MLIDTHTHLESFARGGELPAILARAREAGLTSMITVGTSPEDWTLYRDIAGAHAGIVDYTVGLHPCAVGADWKDAVAQIERFWDGTGVPVALGECGLDRFHLPKDDPVRAAEAYAQQRAAFAAQLEIARRLGCPVVVHSRKAFRDCVEIIDASGVAWARVVFHCFTEGIREMAEVTARGGRGSFTGVLTYKTATEIRAAALAQGLDKLMLETDAPYLTPVPYRGKPNEPAYLRHTAECAANVFDISVEAIAAATTANAREFFRLKS